MANPALTSVLVADDWKKIATAVTSGVVYVANTRPNKYLTTYKLTGEAAPANDTTAINFTDDGGFNISHSESIDVYVKVIGADGAVVVHV